MNKTLKYALSSLALIASAASSSATVFFAENFETYTPDAAVPTDNIWFLRTESGSFTTKDDSTNNDFSGSKYGEIIFDDTAGVADPLVAVRSTYSVTGSATGQVSFKFLDPTSPSTTGNGFLLRLGTNAGNSTTAFAIFIKDGNFITSSTSGTAGSTFASYSLGTTNELDIIYNNSASTLNYNGGSVVSRAMDIYLNGTLVGDDIDGGTIGSSLTVGSAVEKLNFTAKTSSSDFNGALYVDDILMNDAISIPETNSITAWFGILIGLTTLATRRVSNR